jgi:16S rRNA (adenine1518-N6/adenine1519-N6)-dimethyltransferase
MADFSGQGHTPRKRFGQNFLIDETVIERIVGAIRTRPEDQLVEIGPGLGALTNLLAQTGAQLTLVELDRDLVAELHGKFDHLPQVKILSADALKTDFTQINPAKKLRVIGNLPYNISTPLLFHLIDQIDSIQDMHFMLQREVVERITAAPGSGDWGRLGIMLQFFCTTEKLLDVPAEAFHPAPKVESAVVRLVPRAAPLAPIDPKILQTVVRTAFSKRRKTLRNCLKPLISDTRLEALGIDPQARPETLSLEAFLQIAQEVNIP